MFIFVNYSATVFSLAILHEHSNYTSGTAQAKYQ